MNILMRSVENKQSFKPAPYMTGGDFCCFLNEGNKAKKGRSFKDQVGKY